MKTRFLATCSAIVLLPALLCSDVKADALAGFSDITMAGESLGSLRYEGTEYVAANGDLMLGTTTRWYIPAGGVATLWVDGTPAPAPTVGTTSTVKANDTGSRGDNFIFKVGTANNISSIDGINFQETIFPLPTKVIFVFERGGNDSGTVQGILPDGSLGTSLTLTGGGAPYANTGVSVNGSNAFGYVFTSDVPVKGLRITASGHDALTVCAIPILRDPRQSYDPQPENEAEDIPRDVVLTWTPGENVAAANGHIVYLSDDKSKVDNGVGGVTLSTSSYVTPRLKLDTMYYWRVDQVIAPPNATTFKGEVWSFRTEPVAYLITDVQATASSSKDPVSTGPENMVNGSGLTLTPDGQYVHGTTPEKEMWQSATSGLPVTVAFEFDRVYKLHEMKVWNHNTTMEDFIGLGAKEVTIEIADSNTGPWTPVADVTLKKAAGLPDAPATDTIPMNGLMASNVRLTIRSNHGGATVTATGLAEVRFFYIPVVARELEPANGTVLEDTEVTLAWRGGREAAQHKVYLATGDKLASVGASDPTVLATTITAQGSYGSYTASGLSLSQTYVWKIAEVNAVETPATHDSPILSFSTPDYLPVDNMESYKNEPFMEIWATWLDGTDFGTKDPTNGSVVGLDPAAGNYEAAPGFNGQQSLPIWFTNTATAPKSEAIRTSQFGDWTRSGVKFLYLWFRGNPANTGGQLYVKINNTEILYDGDSADIKKEQWLPFPVDLSKVTTGLINVTKLTVGVKGAGATGVVYIDDIRLYTRKLDVLTGFADITAAADAIVSLRYKGTEYVVANNALMLGTTTRWYIPAATGIPTLWAEGDPAPAATTTLGAPPKPEDPGSEADNFLFRSGTPVANDMSSIDAINFQETIFPVLTDTIFVFERGGNDPGTFQAIHADGSLAPGVPFVAAANGGPYADTGVAVGDQNAFGMVFITDVPVKGLRITAPGYDALTVCAIPRP